MLERIVSWARRAARVDRVRPSAADRSGAIRPFDLEPEIESAAALVGGHTMVPFLRLAATYQLAAFLEDARIPGAFVECGTWKGGSAGMMALASLRHGTSPRPLHLFDSFADMCLPDARVDGRRAVAEARRVTDAVLDGSLTPMAGFYEPLGGHGTSAAVRQLLSEDLGYPAELVSLHEGWFQDTVEPARHEVGPIALLRLDTDFYAGTRHCLEHLFDLVVDGGVVIIDDYGCYDGCRLAVDEFLATLPEATFLHHIDAEGRYLVKQQRRG